jgi:HK97 family phage major capsid protein
MRFLSVIGMVLVLAIAALALVSYVLKSPPVVRALERRGMATRKTSNGVGVLMPEAPFAVVERQPSLWQRVKAGFLFALADQRGSVNIQAISDSIATLLGQAQAIQTKAEAEKRDLTAEESKQFDGFLDAIELKEKEKKRLERLNTVEARLDAPGERKVKPDVDGGARVTGGDRVSAKAGTHGFRMFGEFALAVRAATRKARPVVDERLMVDPQDAATTYGSEGTGADGGYLVPPEFKQQLLTKVLSDESLLAHCMQVNTESNAVTFPANENEPWSASGIQAYWEGEAVAPPQSKPALRGATVHVEKLISLVPLTDEVVADASILQSFLMGFVPQKIDYQLNDAILNGSGAGKPQGILKSAALITIAKESGQTAGTILMNNITKMFSRMRPANLRNAIWIANSGRNPAARGVDAAGGRGGGYPGLPARGGIVGPPARHPDGPADRVLGGDEGARHPGRPHPG